LLKKELWNKNLAKKRKTHNKLNYGRHPIMTCILTEQNHIFSNMQDWLLQIMQLIQYTHVSSFSTAIINEFVGGGFYLSQHFMDGYEAMGFDVTQVTQDVE
jgi:hypothetical protein